MENNSKTKILNKLRNADLSGELFSKTEKPNLTNPYIQVSENLAESFKIALEKISGQCFIVNSDAELNAKLTTFLASKNCNQAFVTKSMYSLLNIIDGVELMTNEPPSDSHPISISGCECLSARTGSVIVSSKSSEGRKLHAFAEIHIIIAEENQLFADLPEALESVLNKYEGALPSAITLITGQSRTADIEKTLILGAHGPKELIVFIKK